jgi:hypothetical protein
MKTPKVPHDATDTHYDYKTTNTVFNIHETRNIPIPTLYIMLYLEQITF